MVMTAPRFEYGLQSGANQQTKAVSLTFQGVDKQHYTLEVSVQCAAMAMTHLAARLGELLASIPADQVPDMQPISVRAAEAIPLEDGALALLLSLEGGAQLPLEFSGANVQKLAAAFTGMAAAPGSGQIN